MLTQNAFSHNIIGLALNAIDEHFGEEAQKAIKDFGLDRRDGD